MSIRDAFLLGLKHALEGHVKMVSLRPAAQVAYDAGYKKGQEEGVSKG